MTRVERLAQQEARALHQALTFRDQRRSEEAKKRTKARARAKAQRRERRERVGGFVDDAGFFVHADHVLITLFQTLAPLADVPDPVAVLEGLFADEEISINGAQASSCGPSARP